MAQHTITVSDIEGGVSVQVESTGENTLSRLITKVMVNVAEKVITKVNSTKAGDCNCPACKATRNAAGQAESNEPKPTLH